MTGTENYLPFVIDGGEYVDVRGRMRFCNDFDMRPVKRFYTIRNSEEHPKRGWIMHKKETKWMFPIAGETIVYCRTEGANEEHAYRLLANKPLVLRIPPLTWFLIEQDGRSEVLIFSDSGIGENESDDFRCPIDFEVGNMPCC